MRTQTPHRSARCICKWDTDVQPNVLLLRNIDADCPDHADVPDLGPLEQVEGALC